MKVYGCRMQGGYCGGIVLVAANNIREAYMIAAKHEKCGFWFYFCDEDGCWIDQDANPDVLPSSDRYPFSQWQEYEHLSCDYTEPQLILEESHAE